ncbi:glycosyltransferase family 1 protein [Clostridium tarantellae]|uniref:Glycosyltransferase n=1 Tax=Clostridium tarantellae TaxID=39493 RepID=A0A6I1MIR5_9CLOT|nr:glycosyltransferase family 1 protein [Clostridium tarantellae]MPQ42298.1 glycosyltransferase [Clostridium tarantellae]
MIKILQVVGGMNIGGTETMLMNLYRQFNNGIQFDFISYYDEEAYYDNEIRSLGGKVIRLKAPNKVGMIKAIKDLMEAIKENGPYEAIHTHTLFNCGISVLAGKLAGVKVRVSHAHTTFDNNNSLVKKIYMNTMRTLIKSCSTDFLACSDNAGKYLFGETITTNDRYKKLPNYIDYMKFINCNDKESIRKEFNIGKDDIVIGHVGRFMDAKNHRFIVQIISDLAKKNNKIKCLLVGEGHLKKDINDQVKRLGLQNNVYFLGIRKDIPKILKILDVFLFPSTYEGLGLVLLEAQASGISCLVSEAIQPEADLGVGLFNKLYLNEGSEKWSSEILNIINNKTIVDKEILKNSFENKGYNINDITNNLKDIYKVG